MLTFHEQVKTRFVKARASYQRADIRYTSTPPDLTDPALEDLAVEQYRAAIKDFLSVIVTYEQYLLSIERDLAMEEELELVLSHKKIAAFLADRI